MHEGLGSIALWRDYPQELCERAHRPGLVYSRYGNGFSDTLTQPRQPAYMHEEAQVLKELLDTFEVGAPVLYGHSDGASIALIFAAIHPHRVSGVIAEAPHAFVEGLSLESIAAIGVEFRAGSLRDRMRRHHANADATFFGWNDVWLSPEFSSWSITGMLSSLVAPVLCLQGTNDPYGTLAQVDAIAAASGGPVDRFVLEGCGHAPHRERTAEVIAAVVRWLDERGD